MAGRSRPGSNTAADAQDTQQATPMDTSADPTTAAGTPALPRPASQQATAAAEPAETAAAPMDWAAALVRAQEAAEAAEWPFPLPGDRVAYEASSSEEEEEFEEEWGMRLMRGAGFTPAPDTSTAAGMAASIALTLGKTATGASGAATAAAHVGAGGGCGSSAAGADAGAASAAAAAAAGAAAAGACAGIDDSSDVGVKRRAHRLLTIDDDDQAANRRRSRTCKGFTREDIPPLDVEPTGSWKVSCMLHCWGSSAADVSKARGSSLHGRWAAV